MFHFKYFLISIKHPKDMFDNFDNFVEGDLRVIKHHYGPYAFHLNQLKQGRLTLL
jgi:hypothetical protein